jgi:hypothetical protein
MVMGCSLRKGSLEKHGPDFGKYSTRESSSTRSTACGVKLKDRYVITATSYLLWANDLPMVNLKFKFSNRLRGFAGMDNQKQTVNEKWSVRGEKSTLKH